MLNETDVVFRRTTCGLSSHTNVEGDIDGEPTAVGVSEGGLRWGDAVAEVPVAVRADLLCNRVTLPSLVADKDREEVPPDLDDDGGASLTDDAENEAEAVRDPDVDSVADLTVKVNVAEGDVVIDRWETEALLEREILPEEEVVLEAAVLDVDADATSDDISLDKDTVAVLRPRPVASDQG